MEVGDLKQSMVTMKNCEIKVEDENDNMSESTYGAFLSTYETPIKTRRCDHGSDPLNLNKRAVVVLTRLPEYIIGALLPVTEQVNSETESDGISDSDMLWEPQEDCRDSKSKRKTSNFKKHHTEVMPPPATSSRSTNAPEGNPIVVSSVFAHCSKETTSVRPDLPEVDITVDMVVLARRRAMRWQRGKVVEIVVKEDGRLKYKVSFEEKGRSLVSGHHIALIDTPKLEELYVGARVVISSGDDELCFQPGILAELPSRKNRLRFLVFLDDHTPIYVGLPSLHLVCRPLDNVLDDIPESPHRSFLMRYLKNWPYPHLTHYKVGQAIKVELNGIHVDCVVELVDCSLMQVIFQDNQCKEWIHRGSIRLEHMSKFIDMKPCDEA